MLTRGHAALSRYFTVSYAQAKATSPMQEAGAQTLSEPLPCHGLGSMSFHFCLPGGRVSVECRTPAQSMIFKVVLDLLPNLVADSRQFLVPSITERCPKQKGPEERACIPRRPNHGEWKNRSCESFAAGDDVRHQACNEGQQNCDVAANAAS